MSITYSFVCDDCEVRVWAGQSTYIYKYSYIADFLHNHIGHNIRFLNDNMNDRKSANYKDISNSKREKN